MPEDRTEVPRPAEPGERRKFVKRISAFRRFILIGSVCVTVLISVTVVLIYVQRSDAIAAYQTATINLGNGMSQQTYRAIVSIDGALKKIVTQLSSGPDAKLERIGAVMRGAPSHDLLVDLSKGIASLNALAIVNADGLIENSSSAWVSTAHDVVGQDFFVHFMTEDDRNAFVSVPVKSSSSGKRIAFLARRINDAYGVFLGVVVSEISLDSLEEFYRTAMPAQRSVSLVREDGVVLVRYPPREEEIGRRIPDHNAWYAAVAQGGGAYHASDYFAETPIVAFVKPLNNLPLVVQASVTEAEVLVDWPRQSLWLALGGATAIISVVLLLRFLAKQVDRLERSELSLAVKNGELEEAHGQLDAALSNLPLGVAFFSAAGKLVVCNRRYAEIYDLVPEEIQPGISLAEIVDRRIESGSLEMNKREEYLRLCDDAAEIQERRQTVIELMNDRAILVTHQPMPEGGWIATHEDITERRAADRQVRFLAHNDVLTGLANRASFNEKLLDALARLRRQGEPFAVFVLDLDKFKTVNDTLGHPAGDQLLRETARRLKSSLREADVLARLGGDEFAIIQLGEAKLRQGASGLAKRILNIISDPFDLEGCSVGVGASIGIALAPEDADNSTDLLKMADVALYAVKSAGRNGFRFFDATMLEAMNTRRRLEDDLRVAVSRGEFELNYQPLIDVRTRRPAGFEALLRWRSPNRGLVMPDEFIPLAEETGLIVLIGAWALRQACEDALKWPSHIKVAVNLSPVQLAQSNLLDIIFCALVESGLPPERLELEITETALFKNDVDCVGLIRQLRRLGVSIALDDFGTGYSSLSYLTMVAFDKIKIDRSFTSNMTKRTDCAAIVSAVLALGHSLKTDTVAEGVETEEQFGILRAAGVTLVQGFLFGRPAPASHLVLDDVDATEAVASAA
jgi:diguanylate cyclase (GGDEF)-like protein